MAELPFVGPTYRSQSVTADDEECMNWYVEIMESAGATAKSVLYPRPGVVPFSQLPSVPLRALFFMAGRCFAVGGAVFYEIQSDGTAISRGTMATNNNPATISSNGDGGGQLFITSGGQGFLYDLTANTLVFVVDGADVGKFLGGYFIRLDLNTSTFGLSNLEDGATWDPTMTAQRSLAADPWVGLDVIHNELWLLGEQTSEVWQNAGAANFPFVPIPGAFMEQGTAATFSLARVGSSLVWLGANEQGQNVVYRSTGYQPQPVSTHAVDYALQQATTLADADAFAYQDQGHEFYVLNLPTANQTWVLDTTTELWHRRDYWNTGTGLSEVARPRCHAMAFGRHLVGDRVTGDVLEQDISFFYDTGGVPIRRVRRAPTLTDEDRWAVYARTQLLLDVGLGVTRESPYYAVLLASGAANYFRLGETSPVFNTPFLDSLGAGVAIGTTAMTLGTPGLVGDANTAVTFDGSLQKITLSSMAASTTTFWLEVSIRPDSTQSDANGTIFGGDGAQPVNLVYSRATGQLGWSLGASVTNYAPVLVSGQVYHVSISVAAGVATLYLNGAASGTVSGITTFTPARIGQDTGQKYKGVIDEVVYKPGSTLTAAQAMAHYNATGAVSGDPQLMMRVSKDKGRTWGAERWVSAGAEGRYNTRAIWRNWGRARSAVFELVCTDGTPWRIVDFVGTIQRGTGA